MIVKAKLRFACNGKMFEAGEELPDDVAEFAKSRGYAVIEKPKPKLKTGNKDDG